MNLSICSNDDSECRQPDLGGGSDVGRGDQ